MSNIIDTTIRYLEEKWPGRFVINFFGYLVILVPIALGYVIVTKGMKLKSNDNGQLWVRFKNFSGTLPYSSLESVRGSPVVEKSNP